VPPLKGEGNDGIRDGFLPPITILEGMLTIRRNDIGNTGMINGFGMVE